MPRPVALLLALPLILAACQSRGGVPPNGLTAVLRSIPADAATGPLLIRSGDPAEARRTLKAGPPDETRPAIPPDGWTDSEVEAWATVSPTGSPAFTVIVGSFDTEQVNATLRGKGMRSKKIELVEVFAEPESPETTTRAAVGVAPGRLIYGAPETVERIASFRGGPGSLLDLEGLREVAVGTGRAGTSAVFAPASGCPRPIWIAAAARYEPGGTDLGLIWYYPDAEPAASARTSLSRQLPDRLPGRTELRLMDARNRQAVAILSGSDVRALIAATRPGGPFEGLPECPK